MLCGHVAGQGRRVDVFNGNTVHTLLSDYQSGYGNGGNGYMRVMQFIPSSNTMTVRTFSPTAGALPNATEIANGNFDLSVNLSPGFSLITTLSNVGAGTIELPWLTLEPLTEYEWYVTASDGEYEETSPVFSFTTAGIVPINLLKFQAHAENKQVKLTWTTAEEVNSSKFEIERSSDGKNFMKIGEQKAAGNSVVLKDYQAFDAKPLRGLNFYRLKMVDADNNHRYSRIVQVSMVDKSKGFDVYPNPVSGDEINIVFADDAKGDAMVKLFDLNGRMRLSTVRAVRNNTLAIKHHLSPGVYIISVRINNKDATRKIIIE
jgi:hypothetical protein